MQKFIIAVKAGINYHYTFITIDDFKDNDLGFYFDLIKNSFPTQDAVNNMLFKYRQASERTLYSASDLDGVKLKANNNKDILGMFLWRDNAWSVYL